MKSLKDKVVLITGASTGIGRGVAIAFARAGACVVAVARSAEKLQTLAGELPGSAEKHFVFPADITAYPVMGMLFSKIQERFGKLDIFVHNAGIGYHTSLEKMNNTKLRKVFETNFFSVLQNTQQALPLMKASKTHLVLISSVIGRVAVPNYAAYCSSKFALEALGEAIRPELAVYGIKTTVVCPGLTDTPFSENSYRENPPQLQWRKKQTPEHVARKIVQVCRKPKRDLVLSFGGKMLIFLRRSFPCFLDKIFKRMLCQKRV